MHPIFLFSAGALTGYALSSFMKPAFDPELMDKIRVAADAFPFIAEQAAQAAMAQAAQAAQAEGETMGYALADASAAARGALGRVPGITEAVAMYYTMLDPDTPNRSKLIIAHALLYLASPWDVVPDSVPGVGHIDDAGVIFAAFADVYNNVKPEHKEKAQAWLAERGIEPKPIIDIGRAVEIYYPQEQNKPDNLPVTDYVFGALEDVPLF